MIKKFKHGSWTLARIEAHETAPQNWDSATLLKRTPALVSRFVNTNEAIRAKQINNTYFLQLQSGIYLEIRLNKEDHSAFYLAMHITFLMFYTVFHRGFGIQAGHAMYLGVAATASTFFAGCAIERLKRTKF